MSEKLHRNILVLSGGISHERDVSLRSGRRVGEELERAGHRVTHRDPDATLLASLDAGSFDAVWLALHGASGEDGALQALLRTKGVTFLGSDAEATALAWHKPTAKTLVARAGFDTPPWITLPTETFRELGADSVLAEVLHAIGDAAVVKPSRGGSAQGVTIIEEASELPRALVQAYTYSDSAFIERKVTGTELAITVLDTGDGPLALPAVEIVPRSGIYSFDARYNAGETTFYTPARIDEIVAERAAAMAVAIHGVLGLRHYSRIDLIVDELGQPWFIEANVVPGTTETSLMPLAIEASGRSLGDVYSSLVEAAIAGA
ncbi:D-alanine--D-alanine ligase [Plantibacter flavus]|uniref:D-alanine--D-alanine ligase family protein n=1 Tax=Plantibacter flavus TaxID=150123 RepID=UPI003F14071B